MTLVGTSLGARLIFACLEEIARRHELWEEQVWFFVVVAVVVVIVGDVCCGDGDVGAAVITLFLSRCLVFEGCSVGGDGGGVAVAVVVFFCFDRYWYCSGCCSSVALLLVMRVVMFL